MPSVCVGETQDSWALEESYAKLGGRTFVSCSQLERVPGGSVEGRLQEPGFCGQLSC